MYADTCLRSWFAGAAPFMAAAVTTINVAAVLTVSTAAPPLPSQHQCQSDARSWHAVWDLGSVPVQEI